MMNYKIEVNKVNNDTNLKGMASIVFGDVFKVSNIAIKESENGYYINYPSRTTGRKDDEGRDEYNNIFNPITSEFSTELKENMVKALQTEEGELYVGDYGEELKIEASSHPVNSDKNFKGMAMLYIENCFVCKNFSLYENKDGKLQVGNPSIKTKKTNEDGSPKYKDVAYPVTADARESIYGKIIDDYNEKQLAQESSKPKTR